MGYCLNKDNMNNVIKKWSKDYCIFAPKCSPGGGAFSETDVVRYGQVVSVEEIVFDKKSNFSFKEVLLPISQTLFYFTEDSVKEADGPEKKVIIFLRSCDLHAVKRLDEIYLRNGFEDFYYKRIRENTKFILMGCDKSFDNCFCVDMETNIIDSYDASIDYKDGNYLIDNKCNEFEKYFEDSSAQKLEVTPSYVTKNEVRVNIPDNITLNIIKSKMWDEYDSRCINCGRCNFVCPTCTCFTMQDIYYTDNGKVGERRRVWASCMVDGYTDVAGGGSYRKNNGQRMRFKTLHKVYDYKKRNGYHMCIGCGRCDDICPQYISFSNCINKLEDAMEEVNNIES